MRCFTVVLSFGKLVRDLQTEDLDEDDAVPLLQDLHSTFEVRSHIYSSPSSSLDSHELTPPSLLPPHPQSSSNKFIAAVSALEARGTAKPEATKLLSSLQGEDQDLLALISGEEKGQGAGLADLALRLDFKGVVSDRHDLRSGSRRKGEI